MLRDCYRNGHKIEFHIAKVFIHIVKVFVCSSFQSTIVESQSVKATKGDSNGITKFVDVP